MEKLVTAGKLAEELSVSETAVRRAVRTGRLTAYGKDGAPLPSETKVRPKFLRLREAKKQWEASRFKAAPGKDEPGTLVEARARKVAADAAMQELRLRVRRGELIDKEAQSLAFAVIGREFARALENMEFWA